MEIPTFLIAATVIMIEAQRLVRTICPHCKQPDELSPDAIVKMGVDPQLLAGATMYKGAGCMECNRTGYKGRVGLFEILPVTPGIRAAILARATSDEIRQVAVKEGVKLLREDGLDKVRAGITTLEAVIAKTVVD